MPAGGDELVDGGAAGLEAVEKELADAASARFDAGRGPGIAAALERVAGDVPDRLRVRLGGVVHGAGSYDTPDPAATPGRSLVDRIAALTEEIAALRQRQRDEDDGRLLRALAIGTRGHVFSVGDVFTRSALDPDLAAAVGGLSPKQLGKRLGRVVDRELEGLTVRRVVVSKTGWLWEIHINPDAGASG